MGFVPGLIVGVVLTSLGLAGVINAMYQEGQRLQKRVDELTQQLENRTITGCPLEEDDRIG